MQTVLPTVFSQSLTYKFININESWMISQKNFITCVYPFKIWSNSHFNRERFITRFITIKSISLVTGSWEQSKMHINEITDSLYLPRDLAISIERVMKKKNSNISGTNMMQNANNF